MPFLCFAFGFGPLLDILVRGSIAPHLGSDPPTVSYGVNPGPPWFLSWLLVLNCCYAFIGGEQLEWRRPGLGSIVLCCAGLGVLDGLFASVLLPSTGGSFMMVPVSGIGDLPYDLVFFTAGCCASSRRNAWLEPAEEWWDSVEMPAFVGVCLCSVRSHAHDAHPQLCLPCVESLKAFLLRAGALTDPDRAPAHRPAPPRRRQQRC